MIEEDLKLYLPKYLSAESTKVLMKELENFPKKICGQFYTNNLIKTSTIYQGDGLKDMIVVNLPENKTKPTLCIILSNTCDIDILNDRFYPTKIVYAPIIEIAKYSSYLKKANISSGKIENHIKDIRKQALTQFFYLPSYGSIPESFVSLDRINSLSNSNISRNNLDEKRLFTLSDYGAYMFLFKLSVHFTRIQDKVDRGSILQ